MRLLYGGTFNPPTVAHQAIVRYLLAKYPDAEIIVVPTPLSYGKPGVASDADRLAMLRIAFASFPRVSISDWELKETRYRGTGALLAAFAPASFVLGDDNFAYIDRWIDAPSLVHEHEFLILPRTGVDLASYIASVPFLAANRSHFTILTDFPRSPVSAQDFRSGHDETVVPLEVREYIARHGLYQEKTAGALFERHAREGEMNMNTECIAYSHGFIKVAAASPVIKVGRPLENATEIIRIANSLKSPVPAILVFPEMTLVGYSAFDMLYQDVLYENALSALKKILANLTYPGVVVLGSYLKIADVLYNCAFVLQGGKILGIVPKSYLPHTNEFYESRWFQDAGKIIDKVKSVRFAGADIPFGRLVFTSPDDEANFAVEICADLWAPVSPDTAYYLAGAIMVVNPSASPAYIGKREKRRSMIEDITLKNDGAYVYCSNNASDSTSENVFSAHHLFGEAGEIVKEDRAITLSEKVTIGEFDLSRLHYLRRINSYYKDGQARSDLALIQRVPYRLSGDEDFTFERLLPAYPFVPKTKEDFTDIIDIQAASVTKRMAYARAKKAILGVSGGLDSTLALLSLCHAADAYGFPRTDIIGVSLPSTVTSERTYTNGRTMMEKLGVTFREIPIGEDVKRELAAIGHDGKTTDITYENVQARFRTYTLMNLANKEGGLVIGTSDMSECALGWCTFAGDQMAMYGLNAGLPKTVVKETVRFYKSIYPEIADILQSIIDTPISPELSGSDQKTEEIIGKYQVNDFILYRFLVAGDTPDRIGWLLVKTLRMKEEAATAAVDNFMHRFYTQQYKRITMPEAAKILNLSLSPRTETRLNGDVYPPEKNDPQA